jgi:hypothetical protein
LRRIVDQREVALVLLGEVQVEDGVEAVQDPAQLRQVVGVGVVGVVASSVSSGLSVVDVMVDTSLITLI